MIKKLKSALLSLLALSFVAAPALVPASVYAAPSIENGLCQGSNLEATVDPSTKACVLKDETASGTTKINAIIKTVIDIFSLVVGVVAVIMIIIGGLKYITSGGDSGNITGAKNTILYAIIGLVVVALAQFIVKFVLNRTTAGTN
jgi:hypothetical protein